MVVQPRASTPLSTPPGDWVLPAKKQDAVSLVDQLLALAKKSGASDLHFDPTPAQWQIRLRQDGILRTLGELAPPIATQAVARLKVLAELLTYRTDIPQEGRIDPETGIEGRVSTFPTIHGEKLALRFFNDLQAPSRLEKLGFEPDIFHGLTALLQQRDGAILLTGPGGSGKTTTLYAALSWIREKHREGVHIFTIEDPVERPLEGINQAQVRPGTEFDFARGLRSLLRQDPEVVMVGEIRDPQTASTALEAALTGHLLLSTVHAGSACGVFARLLDMGVEPYALTSGVRGVLNQRLVRRVCPSCQASGCSACGETGYQGRLLLAELVSMRAPLRKAILARADLDGLTEAARESGETGLRAAGQRAVEANLTTLQELDRVLGPQSSEERIAHERDRAHTQSISTGGNP